VERIKEAEEAHCRDESGLAVPSRHADEGAAVAPDPVGSDLEEGVNEFALEGEEAHCLTGELARRDAAEGLDELRDKIAVGWGG
jgi:hypothetical protein